jgi:hypothetical protein
VRTFEDAAKNCGEPEFLAQGTIYPDIVESGKHSAVIKSHHNVGGLPEEMGFEGIIEPLSGLFKDEVRKLGLILGLPKKIVERAQEILAELEQGGRHIRAASAEASATAAAEQPTLFASSLADELAAIDIMTLTPLEALNILYKLQTQARQEAGKQ